MFEITIVICTRNRRESLCRLLESLAGQDMPQEVRVDVLVVDNGSSDGTAEMVREYAGESTLTVRYVREDRIGVAAARNRGVHEAVGEWIAFIDDDETACPGWLGALLEAATKSGADIAGGRLSLAVPPEADARITGTARKHLDETAPPGRIRRLFTYTGPGSGNVLIRKAVFGRIGLFDETLLVRGEDQDLFRRAEKAGIPMVRTEQALVYHHLPPERLTFDALLAVARTNGRSLAYFDRRYRGVFVTVGIVLLRTFHAVVWTAPRYLAARISGKRAKYEGLSCSLATARAYIRGVFKIGGGMNR
jgi:GT2 family glycosyltransferase